MKIEKSEFKGLPIVYRVIIEEIIITDENDIKKCKQYEDDNFHTAIRIVACKYAKETLFIDCIEELMKLEFSNLSCDEDKRQSLLGFINEHFRIIYNSIDI